jgi:hypothetical protein
LRISARILAPLGFGVEDDFTIATCAVAMQPLQSRENWLLMLGEKLCRFGKCVCASGWIRTVEVVEK